MNADVLNEITGNKLFSLDKMSGSEGIEITFPF